MRVAESANGVKEGNRYGSRLVIGKPFCVGRTGKRNYVWSVVAQCDCGKVDAVAVTAFASGKAGRCLECTIKTRKTTATHGQSQRGRNRLYRIWMAMRSRCNNPNTKNYKTYGGKGIRVCDEWNDFACFRLWAISSGYKEDLTIDRIDSSRGYEPTNCQWLTLSENSRKARLEDSRK